MSFVTRLFSSKLDCLNITWSPNEIVLSRIPEAQSEVASWSIVLLIHFTQIMLKNSKNPCNKIIVVLRSSFDKLIRCNR